MPSHCCAARCFAEAVPIFARLCHCLANGGQLYNAGAVRWGCGVRLSIASALLCCASLRPRRASPGFVGQCHARATPSLGPAKPCQCRALALLRHAHASYRTASPLQCSVSLCPCIGALCCALASHCAGMPVIAGAALRHASDCHLCVAHATLRVGLQSPRYAKLRYAAALSRDSEPKPRQAVLSEPSPRRTMICLAVTSASRRPGPPGSPAAAGRPAA